MGAMSALQRARREGEGRSGTCPLVENMPSGTAIRPGDVLRIRNGKTVEVLNTDAEGRLILADALSLASEEKPAAVVDLATLTGACIVALGEKIAGLMGNDDGWIDQVRAAADRVGRARLAAPAAGRLPQAASSPRSPTSRTSARRLTAARSPPGCSCRSSSPTCPWAHLDIAGPAFARRRRRLPPEGRHRLRRAHAARARVDLRHRRSANGSR